jgi:hypothetical protein
MTMDVIRLKAIPECLSCSELMFMMYSIDSQGAVWMNKALLIENVEE